MILVFCLAYEEDRYQARLHGFVLGWIDGLAGSSVNYLDNSQVT